MQLSKWQLLAYSTAAVVVWALYKMNRFYQSGEGRDFMKRDTRKPPASPEQEDQDGGTS